jgi:hypothetical protein
MNDDSTFELPVYPLRLQPQIFIDFPSAMPRKHHTLKNLPAEEERIRLCRRFSANGTRPRALHGTRRYQYRGYAIKLKSLATQRTHESEA